jgi:hypothetical protein
MSRRSHAARSCAFGQECWDKFVEHLF